MYISEGVVAFYKKTGHFWVGDYILRTNIEHTKSFAMNDKQIWRFQVVKDLWNYKIVKVIVLTPTDQPIWESEIKAYDFPLEVGEAIEFFFDREKFALYTADETHRRDTA